MNGDHGDGGSSVKRKRNERVTEVSFESLVTPNFEELARRFPDFGRAWKVVQQVQAESGGSFGSHITQDFSIALTKALLHIHWGLTLTHLPLHHLCPPVPNRYFYVNWIQRDLLPLLASANYFQPIRFLQKTGLDIGTGATAIYPLLFVSSSSAASAQPYRIFATDVDPESVQLAASNVHSNHLESSIQIHQVAPTDRQQGQNVVGTSNSNMSDEQHCHGASSATIPVGPLRRSLEHLPPNTLLDFCLTNPPFYAENDGDNDNGTDDGARTNPRAGDGRIRTAMTVSEGSYPGGEVGFVVDMIVDTLVLFANNQSVPGWSSCMCGKKASWVQLHHIVNALLGPGHCQATEFGPGNLTRWFLAWTLERPQIRSPLAKVEGFEFVVDFDDNNSSSIDTVTGRIQEYCLTLPGWELAVDVTGNNSTGQQWLQIREVTPSPVWNDDATFPVEIQRALALFDSDCRMQLLPEQGHFLVDVTVTTRDACSVVQVQVYQHSAFGKKAVDKIKSQLQGEVCRTNRRWRRKLQREEQEKQSVEDSIVGLSLL